MKQNISIYKIVPMKEEYLKGGPCCRLCAQSDIRLNPKERNMYAYAGAHAAWFNGAGDWVCLTSDRQNLICTIDGMATLPSSRCPQFVADTRRWMQHEVKR